MTGQDRITATTNDGTTVFRIPADHPDAVAYFSMVATAATRLGCRLSAEGADDGSTVVTVWGGTGYTTLPLHGETVTIGTLPAPPRPAWHPAYGTTPPAPVADRGCGCDGR